VSRFEDEGLRWTKEAEKTEAVLSGMMKKNTAQVLNFADLSLIMVLQESAYDVAHEDLFNATVKLEEREKVYGNAEGEVRARPPGEAGCGAGRIRHTEDLPARERGGHAGEQARGRGDASLGSLILHQVSGLLRACLRADDQIQQRNKLEIDISTNEEDIGG
jgi:hypothetical protein